MYERYTQNARRVIFWARYEASQYGSRAIGPEHLLLGIFRETALAQKVLGYAGATETIRKEIEAQIVRGDRIPTSVEIPLSNEARDVLKYAEKSADQLGHEVIECEHLLLGILREEDCLAARILTKHAGASSVMEASIRASVPGNWARVAQDWVLDGIIEGHGIRPLTEKFSSAWERSDVAALAALFAHEAQLWDKGGVAYSGPEIRDTLQAYLAQAVAGQVHMNSLLVLPSGLAVVAMAWPLITGKPDAGQREEGLGMIIVARNAGGEWKIESAHVVQL